MRLGPEIPLPAFPGLMHLWVALAAGVLGRRGRVDDGRIHDGPGADADALALHIQVHHVQHLAAQIVLRQQVAKAQHGRLVRRRRSAQIDAGKAA